MVSATHTLGNFFGSGDFVSGFFLNNQIDNYSLSPDSPNYLESEKVSRSFTSPSILKNDEQTIGIGSPGGKRIPAVMSDVLTRYLDRKSTRLNSSHVAISYAVFCLKKKT